MATKSIKIVLAVSIVFYILLGFYLWYSVYSIRNSEFEKASETASFINSEIDSAYSVDFSFSSRYFLDKTSDLFDQYPELAGILIDSGADKLHYIKLRDSRLIKETDPDLISSGAVPGLILSHPFMKVSYTSLYFGNGVNVRSSLVFDLLDRSMIFPVLRNTLIVALAYLVIIVILYSVSEPGKKPARTSISETDEFIEQELEPPAIDDLPSAGDLPSAEDLPSAGEQSSGMYSDRSGLVWEHFLSEKLDAELKRAASFDQDSCLVFLSIVSPSGFIPYRNISELIIEHFKYKDLAFESGDHSFCIIVPEKDIDEGQIEVERFIKSILNRFPESGYKIYAGLTSRNSRLLSEKRMIKEAKAALAKAEEEPVSTTISFRTDLSKYRDYIASKV